MSRAWLSAGLTLAFAMVPGLALAEPGDSCVSGFERGQELQKQGHALKARAELRLCAGACPEMLAAECRAWLSEVEKKIGRARVEVKDGEGHAVANPRIEMDGEVAASAEIEVDPGAHAISVKASGFLPAQRNIDVAAGATVPVSITLSPVPAAATETPSGSRKPLSIGLGVAGIAGILAGTTLLVYGKADEGRLAGSCKNMCDPGSVASIERAWIAGGVALGAGALLGAAAVLLWPSSQAAKTVSSLWRPWAMSSGGGLTFTGELQ